MRVLEAVPLDVPMIDLSSRTPEGGAADLKQIIHEDAGRPFDLEAGPLVRVQPSGWRRTCTRSSSRRTTSSATVGPRTSSSVSWAGFTAHSAGATDALPAPMPFREYARTQAEWKKTPEHAAVESWWAEKFVVPVSPLSCRRIGRAGR